MPTRVAKLLTEVFSPAIVVCALPYAVAAHSTQRFWPTLGWGTLVAVLAAAAPMGYIIRGARRGRWEGHHVRNREGRTIPLLVILGSNLVGLAVTLLGGAPWPVVALQLSMLASLVVTMAITAAWKISLHTSVAAGAVVVLATEFGPFWYLAALLVAAIGWSRVALRDHTLAQVTAGAILGALLGGLLFVILT